MMMTDEERSRGHMLLHIRQRIVCGVMLTLQIAADISMSGYFAFWGWLYWIPLLVNFAVSTYILIYSTKRHLELDNH